MEELNYMAVNKDGRFVAVVSPKHPKDAAKEVAKWIRGGFSVERCNDDFVRKHFGDILATPKDKED